MDHSHANCITINNEKVSNQTIESDFTSQERKESLQHGEKKMHNIEQQLTSKFYDKIAQVILKADRILLFGPTDAKQELWNTIKEDHHFDDKSIVAETCVNFTENQKIAFIKKYFELSF